jgi:hypothetical protein
MRSYFFIQLFFLFGIFFPVCVGVPFVSAQNDPFLSPETVPFPFINEPDQNAQTQQSAPAKKNIPALAVPSSTVPMQTVPVPPDTFVANHDEGYVPNIYYQVAPDPPSVLRPRYRNNSNGNIGNTREKQSDKSQKSGKSINKFSKSDNFEKSDKFDNPEDSNTSDKLNKSDKPDTDELLHPIRQVVASDAPAPPAEFIEDSVPASPTSNTPSSSLLKYPVSLLPQKKRTNPVTTPQKTSQSPYTVNNTHTCDEITCGGEGCSEHSSPIIFQHLSKQTPKRGLCDCCGFLRCTNKTVGAWYFDGWFSVGGFMNTHYPENRNNVHLYYNDRNAEAVMNQLYLTFGRRINSHGGRWDFGGRIDFLYGTDYFFTSSVGLETHRYNYISSDLPTLEPLEASLHWNSNSGTRRLGTVSLYGLSLPQAYAEMFIPVGNGITVKAGHFYSGMGIESVMSPENFFYSHSYSFMYGSPTTLTGMTATAKLSSRFSAMLGFSRGWNIFDKANDNLSGLAGLEWKSFDKRTALSFLIHSGRESLIYSNSGESVLNGDNRTGYALTLQHQLAPRWYYALEHTFGYEKNGAALDLLDGTRGTARWYSFAHYLQWKWSERFALGLRGEWFRDNGQSRIQKDAVVTSGLYHLEGEDYFQITLGANWKPTRYITIRPEIRYDWSNVVRRYEVTNVAAGIYSNDKKQMFSFAIDGIFRF